MLPQLITSKPVCINASALTFSIQFPCSFVTPEFRRLVFSLPSPITDKKEEEIKELFFPNHSETRITSRNYSDHLPQDLRDSVVLNLQLLFAHLQRYVSNIGLRSLSLSQDLSSFSTHPLTVSFGWDEEETKGIIGVAEANNQFMAISMPKKDEGKEDEK